jgi:hypothetical protein
MTRRLKAQHGFTIMEMLISTLIMLTVTAGIFTVMNPSQGIFQTQPEVSDVQQRLRVGVDMLKHDLMMSGAGAYSGTQSGSLVNFFAPVLPNRQGWMPALDDAPGVVRSDAITMFFVPTTSTQTMTSGQMPATSAELKVENPPGCPPKDLCGFEVGMQVLIYDETGAYDPVTITNVQDDAGHLQRNKQGPLSKTYDKGAKVVQMNQHVYYLDSTTDQLMHYDGHQSVVPVLDNIVGLKFEYYGEPSPPVLRRRGVDLSVTYGPRPPALGVTQTGWAPGENCTIQVIGGVQEPRLAVLGAPGSGLVHLQESDMKDGPWCPNDSTSNRFDADLFRVRKIRVSLRVQTGNAALRRSGYLGYGDDALFARPGTSQGGYRQVPDQAIRFDVTPRNLNLGR